MPTYDYRCEHCGTFEVFQGMNEPLLVACPTCGRPVRRLIGAGAGLVFKGSGFYSTDYRKPGYAERAKADAGPPSPAERAKADTAAPPSADAKGDAGAKPAADAKPAAGSKPASDAKSTTEAKPAPPSPPPSSPPGGGGTA